jgi:hypothetical protein
MPVSCLDQKRKQGILRQAERKLLAKSLLYPCEHCGEFHEAIMDWHHIDPVTKDKTVSRLLAGKFALKRVLTEIEKCICLCSNCHRKLHYFEKT